ncbi:MAG: hypothetical protein IPM82_01535 [Saprospiraceae bacterium]|nr:hypothetical protein [Saprospiraceae bacterium]
MRVLDFHLWCDAVCRTFYSFLEPKGTKSNAIKTVLLVLALLPIGTLKADAPAGNVITACDNVVNGGTIAGDEFGCPNPTWDPAVITSLTLPTGGSRRLGIPLDFHHQ